MYSTLIVVRWRNLNSIYFKWNSKTFSNPKAMLPKKITIKELNSVYGSICILLKNRFYLEGMEKGYLLFKKENGSVWQWDMWQSGMGLVDFTNKQATNWCLSYLKQLLDMVVDFFKTDFGERIPTDVVYADGSDAKRMHNYYIHLYNKAVFELLIKEKEKMR